MCLEVDRKICTSISCVSTKQNISITIKKTMVCYHRPRNIFGQVWMSRFSNQTIISKLQKTEKFYGWLGAEQDNISLNTQQLAMSKYSTYKGPTISLDQVITKKCNIV
jgi:hypothetical protein